ncbi:MAG: hypothetical protein M1828_001850 [Chrysothrix sp. TS-e1954]|nr:MAG: hypothetical protein M1828_001850 [Chrysothrix sp. TS-e1954]
MIPSHPSDRPPSANDRNPQTTSYPAAQRAPPSAWGSASSQTLSSRRGLTPIATSANPNSSRPTSSSHSPRNPWSPINQSQTTSSVESRAQGRSSSISSSHSAFSPPLPPSQQTHSFSSQAYTPRSRTSTNPSTSQLAPNTASSQGAASGAPSGSAGRYTRASPSLSQSGFVSAPGSIQLPASGAGQSGQLSKIVSAQLSLLLSTIKDDKDRTKWESQREQIRKLVDANGMEVFTKYFRRLLSTNASQIWSNGRGTIDTSGSYPILVEEMQKIMDEPTQAEKVRESIEFGDGEIFKDFDLAAFMDHFSMGPIAKIALASAFTRASKSDLRSKAERTIKSSFPSFLGIISDTMLTESSTDPSPAILAAIIDRLARQPPERWDSESYNAIVDALERSSQRSGSPIPVEVSASLLLFELVLEHHPIVRLLVDLGSRATESKERCKTLLDSVHVQDISLSEVASSLLFMVIAKPDPPYDLNQFISCLRDNRAGQRLDWQDVVHEFDREGLQITKAQFRVLFDGLMPLAREFENFDLQLLWGGNWHWQETQLSFATAFLSFTQDELDASEIPRLRRAFTMDDFQDAPEDVKQYAESAVRHPLVSTDAAKALFNMVFRSSDTYARAQSLGVVENIINMKMDLFVASVSALPKPWGALQDQAMKQLISPFFFKTQPTYNFVFFILWKRDSAWLEARLLQFYQQKSTNLTIIFDLAQEQGWLEHLVGLNVELSLDLAAFAHGKDVFDLEAWLHQLTQSTSGPSLPIALTRFLQARVEDEVTQREGSASLTVPLTVRTVHALLKFLGESSLPEDDQVQLQRACIHSYPRLVNYGEGHDAVIDLNGKDGNAISPEADSKMQEHYKQMYSGESEVREVIEALQKYKHSNDAGDQDLFACMIFGLFDEYNCFGEYPLEALATTAVLFGGVINFDLLSRIALKAALSMVLESVRDFAPEESMYKFGLQALLHFRDRLPEWRMFSERLLQVQGLRGTPIEETARKVMDDLTDAPDGDKLDAAMEPPIDSFLAAEMPEFRCLGLDPPHNAENYEEPSETVKEGILFIFNNLSERNLQTKMTDLKSKLNRQHYHWFANFLVDQRIRTQGNYHPLYMDLLTRLDDSELLEQVLRQTYAVAFRMLNADSTMNSSHERSLLKSLGGWLGLMTLAKDIPIRHRNISFKDLLSEAYDTNRLIVAIPFTCYVLANAGDSRVFKLPCAWTMEVLQLLLELYHHADLKLQLKFEIEVCYKKLGVDEKKMKDIQPSDAIRSRPAAADPVMPSSLSDGMDGFSDMSLMNLNRRGLHERFSPATIPELSEVETMLAHNYPTPNSPWLQARLRQTLTQAVERAVHDIIGPVVERSVTIAAISTTQLIVKDFASEPDAERLKASAHKLVKDLASSLASVTCKEPMRAGITNNIRLLTSQLHMDQGFPEGAVMMFVNDNLDNLCELVQTAAENASVPEVDTHIADAIALRQSGQFAPAPQSRWAYQIPEPFKPSPDGLNQEQMAIYEGFGRDIQGSSGHVNTTSQDSGRQYPDVLSEQYVGMAGLATPDESAGNLRQGLQNSAQQSTLSHTRTPQPLMNGYSDSDALENHIPSIAADLIAEAISRAEEEPTRDLTTFPTLEDAWQRLRGALAMPMPLVQRDTILTNVVEQFERALVQCQTKERIVDVFAKIMNVLCSLSDQTRRDVYRWVQISDDAVSSPTISIALLKHGLVDARTIDAYLAARLHDRTQDALVYLGRVIDEVLLNEPPAALRGDFATSMSALSYWLSEEPNAAPAQEMAEKLHDASAMSRLDSPQGVPPHVRGAQMEYVFDEWVRLQFNDGSPAVLTSFIHQLDQRNVIVDQESSLLFFRTCLEASIATFERAESMQTPNLDAAFLKVDALAKLVVLASVHMRKIETTQKSEQSVSYFDGIMSLSILTLARHYHRSTRFNQRIFLRLFSSLIFEITTYGKTHEPQNDMLLTMARKILLLSPQVFPAFAFSWLSLISHWMFMPTLLKMTDQTGYKIYCDLLTKHLTHLGELVKPLKIERPATELYRGTVTLLLILHHDFPEFLAENHFTLLNAIPVHCIQMRSLVISASASAFPDQPDPFTDGLKVDRLDEVRRTPMIRGDTEAPLRERGILRPIIEVLQDDTSDRDGSIGLIADAICNSQSNVTGIAFSPVNVDIKLVHALVLSIVVDADEKKGQQGLQFKANAPHTQLVDALIERLPAEAQYHFLSAIVNQLRYPNSHTHYFSYLIFHLFRAGQTDAPSSDIQALITRILLERLLVHRPHPWGLIVTTLEFFRNRTYRFWDLPCVKSAPDVEAMFRSLFQQMNQHSRAMA